MVPKILSKWFEDVIEMVDFITIILKSPKHFEKLLKHRFLVNMSILDIYCTRKIYKKGLKILFFKISQNGKFYKKRLKMS